MKPQPPQHSDRTSIASIACKGALFEGCPVGGYERELGCDEDGADPYQKRYRRQL